MRSKLTQRSQDVQQSSIADFTVSATRTSRFEESEYALPVFDCNDDDIALRHKRLAINTRIIGCSSASMQVDVDR